MLTELQSRLPSFRTRLSETIVWCSAQAHELNPISASIIAEIRRLHEEASDLFVQAQRSQRLWFRKSALRKQAMALSAKARSIADGAGSHQLRSVALKPQTNPFASDPTKRAVIVDTIAEQRAQQSRIANRYPDQPLEGLAHGRLLLYAPDENLFDGAAEIASNGFFDVDNTPPWDTWVCFFDRYLVSWVPPQLLELVSDGINVNPEECIFWAPETRRPQ